MAVVAGHLGVRLDKSGQYILHAEARGPSASDVDAARRLVCRAMLLAAAFCLGLGKMVRP